MSPSKVEEHSMDTWGTDSGLIFYKETHPTTAQTELSHDRRRTIKGLLQNSLVPDQNTAQQSSQFRCQMSHN